MTSENKNIDPIGLLPKIFSGEASMAEEKLVTDWLSSSISNQKEYDTFLKIWNSTGIYNNTEDIRIDAEWKRMEKYIDSKRPKQIHLYRRVLQIAASVLFITALSYFGIKNTGYKINKAPKEDISSVILEDGSKITLNAGSKITYKNGFGSLHRNIHLKGEAYFEVEKNKIPFIVIVDEVSVQVTGTKFNVNSYPDNAAIKVAVTEGKVKLYETDKPVNETSIIAGELGLFEKTDNTIKKTFLSDMNELAWKTKFIEFNNTPLQEVAKILHNTYHVPFSLDSSLFKCSVTVRFENQPIDSILNVLKSTLDITIVKKRKQIKLTGKGC